MLTRKVEIEFEKGVPLFKQYKKIREFEAKLEFVSACQRCQNMLGAPKIKETIEADILELVEVYLLEMSPPHIDCNDVMQWQDAVLKLEQSRLKALEEELIRRGKKAESLASNPTHFNQIAPSVIRGNFVDRLVKEAAWGLAKAQCLINMNHPIECKPFARRAENLVAMALGAAAHGDALGEILVNPQSDYAQKKADKFHAVAKFAYNNFTNNAKNYQSLRAASRCKELQAIALQYSIEIGVPLAESNIENWLYNKLREQHKLAKSKHVTTPSKS